MHRRTTLTMLATGLAAAALVAPATTATASPPMPEPPGPTATTPEPTPSVSVTVTPADGAWVDELQDALRTVSWPAEWAGGRDVVLVLSIQPAGD